jgi:hypothetical protein
VCGEVRTEVYLGKSAAGCGCGCVLQCREIMFVRKAVNNRLQDVCVMCLNREIENEPMEWGLSLARDCHEVCNVCDIFE